MRGWSLALVALVAAGCAEPAIEATPAHRAAEVVGRAPAGARPPARVPKRPRAEESLTPDLASSDAGAKIVALVLDIKDTLVTTRYQARTVAKPKAGEFLWDCSGMANWILRRTAPRARRALRSSRPRAVDYYKVISRAPLDKARRGWQRLAHVSDARPGDVFAFPRSPISTSKISGHVGFFAERPWRATSADPRYEMWAARIVDATGLPHQDDTRDSDGEGGFGFGTFLFVNEPGGDTVAYGWFGTRSRGFMPTHVAYGRVVR